MDFLRLKNKLGIVSLLALMWCTVAQNALAQITYPVESKMVITPPYSLFLTDYATPGKISATLTLMDPLKVGYKIKARLVIKSPDKGVIIKTKPGSEIVFDKGLDFGVPTPVSLLDMQTLFDFKNLDITPVSVLTNGGRLPEGLYFMNLEIIDGNISTEVLVSNVNLGAQLAWITLNDPPFLNFPANKKTITPLNPQNIVFQWTPRHIQSLNSEAGTVYTFRLIEVAPNQNPYQAFLSTSSPVFEVKDIQFPYYNLTQLDLQLVDGKQYAWQVQATTRGGKDMFKNEGLSEVFSFYYTSVCPSPVLPSIQQRAGIAELKWNAPIMPTTIGGNALQSYMVMYRPSGSSTAWQLWPYSIQGKTAPYLLSLDKLEPGKFYDIQIKSVCTNNESDKVYAGAAKNEAATTCDNGPKQLNIKDDPAKPGQKLLAWETVQGASGYRLKREDKGTWVNVEMEPLTVTSYSLGGLPVKVRVDAICSNEDKPGIEYLITSTTTGHHGDCLTPSPLGFKTGELQDDSRFTAEWDTESVYEKYTFKYRPKGSINEAEWVVKDTTAIPIHIPGIDGTTYEYAIVFTCSATEKDTTDMGYFQVQKHQTITVDPPTGNCFPPAHTAYEVTSTTTCDLIWDKIGEATKYQVAYAIAGTDDWQIVEATRPKITLEKLAPNKKYKYKVSAICKDGNTSIASDTVNFDTGKPTVFNDDCEKITSFDTVSTDFETIILYWEAKEGHSSYLVTYHDVNEDITSWHTYNLNRASLPSDTAVISNLKAGKTYEFQIQPYCGTEKGPKSIVKEYSTRKAPALTTDSNFVCGKEDAIPVPGPCHHDPKVNEIFHAADFDVRVDNVLSANAGEGVMILPYMNNALVKVEYKGVKLDADERMCQGKAWVVTVKLNAIGFDNAEKVKGFVDQANKLMDDLDKNINEIQGYVDQAEDAYNKAKEVSQQIKDKIAELKQALKDYKAKKDAATPSEKKSWSDKIKALMKDVGDGLKNIDLSNVGKDVLAAADKLADLVKKLLNEIAIPNRDRAKKSAEENADDKVSRRSSIDNLNKKNKELVIGENDKSSMDTLGLGIQTVSLDAATINYMKANNADFKNYHEKSVAINARKKIINEGLAYALVALDILSDTDQLKAVVGYVRNDLKKDVTDLLTSSIQDALDGKNPDFEKKVKGILDAKIKPLVAPYISW